MLSFELIAGPYKLPVRIHGNPNGEPLLFLHGGPGYRCDLSSMKMFDLSRYRLIFIEQRGGSGCNLPGELEHNTTHHLIEDLENLRKILNITSWTVYGQSWGTTLALVYAIIHPSRVNQLFLKGVFLGRKEDIDWLYNSKKLGSYSEKIKEAFDKYLLKPLQLKEDDNVLEAFGEALLSDPSDKPSHGALDLSICWAQWEDINCGNDTSDITAPGVNPDYCLVSWAIARVEISYFLNECFLSENFILKNLHKIQCPIMAFQGAEDRICPASQAEELLKTAHEKQIPMMLITLEKTGHSTNRRLRKMFKDYTSGKINS